MFSYEDRLRAVPLYIKLGKRIGLTIRQRLKLANSELSPEKALEKLRMIQRRSVSINSSTTMAALNIKKPSQNPQLTRL